MSYFSKLMEQTGMSYPSAMAAPSRSLSPVPQNQGAEPLQVVEEERVAENTPTPSTNPQQPEPVKKMSPILEQEIREAPPVSKSVLENALPKKEGALKSVGSVLEKPEERMGNPILQKHDVIGSKHPKEKVMHLAMETPLEDIRVIEEKKIPAPSTGTQAMGKPQATGEPQTMGEPTNRNYRTSAMRTLSMPEQKIDKKMRPIQEIVEEKQVAGHASQLPGDKPSWEKQTASSETENALQPGLVLSRVREWVSKTPTPSESSSPLPTRRVEREIYTRDQEIKIEKPLEMKQLQLSIGAINLTIEGEPKPKAQTIKSRPKTKPDRPALSDTKLSRYYLR